MFCYTPLKEVNLLTQERYVLAETVSGEFYKFFLKPRDQFLIKFENGIVLGMSESIHNVSCYTPNEDDIYAYVGDVGFEANNDSYKITVHSQGIDSMKFGNAEEIRIPFESKPVVNVSVGIDPTKVKSFFDDAKTKF